MYFGGVQTLSVSTGFLSQVTVSPYDVFVAAIAGLLFSFFLTTATRETIRLAKENK
jgi:hypothetical protein